MKLFIRHGGYVVGFFTQGHLDFCHRTAYVHHLHIFQIGVCPVQQVIGVVKFVVHLIPVEGICGTAQHHRNIPLTVFFSQRNQIAPRIVGVTGFQPLHPFVVPTGIGIDHIVGGGEGALIVIVGGRHGVVVGFANIGKLFMFQNLGCQQVLVVGGGGLNFLVQTVGVGIQGVFHSQSGGFGIHQFHKFFHTTADFHRNGIGGIAGGGDKQQIEQLLHGYLFPRQQPRHRGAGAQQVVHHLGVHHNRLL